MKLTVSGGEGESRLRDFALPLEEEGLYISPPWIDFHAHVYHGVTSFGLPPDDIGYKTGVHLLVDAGSAGPETLAGLRDYVAPRYKTKVKAFLNISTIGLVTMREHHDLRHLDPERTAACVAENRDLLVGVKVRTCKEIVEDKGLEPLRRAIQATELAGCPLMVHVGEAPPSNEEILSLLRRGDTLSHCFHGKRIPLWKENGEPIPALKEVLDRGVCLDVAHGAASMDRDVAASAIARGFRNFSISTDLHLRNVGGPVHSLPWTMSKFLSLGLTLEEVVRGVTQIPAERLGLSGWCGDLQNNATIFRLRKPEASDPPCVDAMRKEIFLKQVIQPVGVIMEGEWISLEGGGGL